MDTSDHDVAVLLRLLGASTPWVGLTTMQALFIVNYLTVAGGNAAMAYRMAGYSRKGARQSAKRLLTDAYIQDAIREVAPLLAGGEGLLENILLEAALTAVKKHEVKVMEKGKGKEKEKLTVTTLGGPDFKARISAAEKLKALKEQGTSEGAGVDSNVMIFEIQNLETFELTEREKQYKGFYPAKE